MTLENHLLRPRDVSDASGAGMLAGAGNFGVDMANPRFNRHISEIHKSNTARIHDLSVNSGRNDANMSTPSIQNIDASPGFQQQVGDAYRQSLSRLNQETQEKLKNSKVVTVDHTRKAISGMPDVPAVTPDMSEHKGNMMVFSERGVKDQKAPIKDVMNHEIFHAVDNSTGVSKDPELRRAIDKGISRLSATDQHHIAVRNKQEAAQRYAEFAGDVMAMEMGSNAKDLAYVSKVGDPFNNFREARELMQKRYMQQ